MLFQDVDEISYKDIATTTGIEAGELKRTLQSLACGKVGLCEGCMRVVVGLW